MKAQNVATVDSSSAMHLCQSCDVYSSMVSGTNSPKTTLFLGSREVGSSVPCQRRFRRYRERVDVFHSVLVSLDAFSDPDLFSVVPRSSPGILEFQSVDIHEERSWVR
jgi:hypothetical protein